MQSVDLRLHGLVLTPTSRTRTRPRWRAPALAVEAGAVGDLLKDTLWSSSSPRSTVPPAERPCSPPGRGGPDHPMRTPTVERLTARETEILTLVAAGMSNRAVGQALFVGEATVKSHLLRLSQARGE